MIASQEGTVSFILLARASPNTAFYFPQQSTLTKSSLEAAFEFRIAFQDDSEGGLLPASEYFQQEMFQTRWPSHICFAAAEDLDDSQSFVAA